MFHFLRLKIEPIVAKISLVDFFIVAKTSKRTSENIRELKNQFKTTIILKKPKDWKPVPLIKFRFKK